MLDRIAQELEPELPASAQGWGGGSPEEGRPARPREWLASHARKKQPVQRDEWPC